MGRQEGVYRCTFCGAYETIVSITVEGEFLVNCSLCTQWRYYRVINRRAAIPSTFQGGVILRQITVSSYGVYHTNPECPKIDKAVSILWTGHSDKALKTSIVSTAGKSCDECLSEIEIPSLLDPIQDNDDDDEDDDA